MKCDACVRASMSMSGICCRHQFLFMHIYGKIWWIFFSCMAQLVFTLLPHLSLILSRYICTHFDEHTFCVWVRAFIMWISATIHMPIWIRTHLFCTMTQAKLKCLDEIASGNSEACVQTQTHTHTEHMHTREHIFVNVFKTANKTNMTDIKRSCCSFGVPSKQHSKIKEQGKHEIT